MAPAFGFIVRRANDRSRGLYRVGRGGAFGWRECREDSSRQAANRSAAHDCARRALALYRGSAAQKFPTDERELRSAFAAGGARSWQGKKRDHGAKGAGGHGSVGSQERRDGDPYTLGCLRRNLSGRSMSSRRLGFIDIGTNTILCLIAELKSDGSFNIIDDLAEITRLGQGVDRAGEISSEGEERSLQVLRHYLERCRSLDVEEIIAVGTSALRDARNSAEVRARFKAQLGFEVRLISGNEEAAYSFLAIQKGLALAGQELLVVDVGGGSTEFIRGNAAGISQAVSINIGTVRLTEQFLHSDPVRKEECENMIRVIEKELARLPHQWLRDGEALTL